MLVQIPQILCMVNVCNISISLAFIIQLHRYMINMVTLSFVSWYLLAQLFIISWFLFEFCHFLSLLQDQDAVALYGEDNVSKLKNSITSGDTEAVKQLLDNGKYSPVSIF